MARSSGEAFAPGGTATRLHPITWLILLAIALRLAADAINLADLLRVYAAHGGDRGLGWFWPRDFARQEREIAQTLVYFVDAAMVEGLSRVWRALRDQRLGQARGTA